MASGQTAGVTLGWPGISCATGPTPIGPPAYTYPPSREVIQGNASLGCGCWFISPSQSPHESVPPQTGTSHDGSAQPWPGGCILPLVRLLWEKWQGVARPALLLFPFLSWPVEKAGNKMATPSVNTYTIYGELWKA